MFPSRGQDTINIFSVIQVSDSELYLTISIESQQKFEWNYIESICSNVGIIGILSILNLLPINIEWLMQLAVL